jgi:hypothetical protein
VAAQWQRSGSAVAAQWQRSGSAVAAQWQRSGSAAAGGVKTTLLYLAFLSSLYFHPALDRAKAAQRNMNAITV